MKFLQHLLSSSILLMSVLLSFHAVEAKSSPFYWEFINVEIDVQKNGDMLVTETQKYVFTAAHTNERYRYIPLNRLDRIDNVEVFEGEKKLAASTNTENGQQWIKWQHTLNPPESHIFTIKYRVKGGLHIQSKEDLLYWKALFKERSAPINNGTVTVHLPESLAGRIDDLRSFGGVAYIRQIDDRTVEFILRDTLPPGQELEVRVAFPHGILAVSVPQWQKRKQKTHVASSHKTKSKNSWDWLKLDRFKLDRFKLIGYILFSIFGICAVIRWGDGAGRCEGSIFGGICFGNFLGIGNGIESGDLVRGFDSFFFFGFAIGFVFGLIGGNGGGGGGGGG
ncbi:MAG: DUF2207 domain-containing protein [Candidatus Electrothrix sp. GM3_4]|nr:DUF2207 domain-containing protein [Candidatus Electrothrix sp. GM3_4]